MGSSLVLAQLAITLLPKIQTGITELINFINTVKTAAQQTGEWTPEMDQAFRDSLIEAGQDPAAQPDPEN